MNHCLFINNNEHLFRRVNCFCVYISFAGLYNVHFEAKSMLLSVDYHQNSNYSLKVYRGQHQSSKEMQ